MNADFAVRRTTQAVSDADRRDILADPGFGRHFTDHMTSAIWRTESGWGSYEVRPLEPYSLHPSAAVLHYAQEIFEGLKAYRHADGSVWLFRPMLNARRFQRSARRMALPELAEETFLASIEALVRADEAWVPGAEGERSLYLRPYMFASEAFLGVRPAAEIQYAVIASPAGAYFPNGVAGVNLWISDTYTRSAPGGTGAAKTGGNYAASLIAQCEAQQHGCDQVLYLNGGGSGALEESATMNVCLVTTDDRLLTPRLGTILDGVTRDSVLALAAEHGLTVEERDITRDELHDGCRTGSIAEAFACGTAAVITPIIGFQGPDYALTVGTGQPGKYSLELRGHILDIQYGRVADRHGWLHRVL